MFAVSTFRLPHLVGGNVRGGTRGKSAPGEGRASWSPGPHRSPRPGPAGGFPGLNGTAGELDRGRGCQLPRFGKGLREKKCNPVKKFGEGRLTQNTPQQGKHGGGGGKGEWRGTQGYPLFAGMGGVRKSTHTQKEEREVKRQESERWMKCVCVGGCLRVGPGDPPSPHGAGPGRARGGQAARAIQRPGALLSLGRGW